MSGMDFTDFVKKNVVDPGFKKLNSWGRSLGAAKPIHYGRSPYIDILERETKARHAQADKDLVAGEHTGPTFRKSFKVFYDLVRDLKPDIPASLEELDRLSKDPRWVANQQASIAPQIKDWLASKSRQERDYLAQHLEYAAKVLQQVGPAHSLDLVKMSPNYFNIGFIPTNKPIPKTFWEKLDYKINPNNYKSVRDIVIDNVVYEASKGLTDVKAELKKAENKYIQDMIAKYGPWVLGGAGLAGLLLLLSNEDDSSKAPAPGVGAAPQLWNRFENWKW